MQGHRRRRATQRSPATPISPKGGGGTASISLSLLLHDVTDIASSLLHELDAVALATNVMVFMGRDTIARTMYKFSTAETKSSGVRCAPAVLRSVGLLNVLKSTFAGASIRALPGRRFRRFVTRTYA